jgi:hypothetical protein
MATTKVVEVEAQKTIADLIAAGLTPSKTSKSYSQNHVWIKYVDGDFAVWALQDLVIVRFYSAKGTQLKAEKFQHLLPQFELKVDGQKTYMKFIVPNAGYWS